MVRVLFPDWQVISRIFRRLGDRLGGRRAPHSILDGSLAERMFHSPVITWALECCSSQNQELPEVVAYGRIHFELSISGVVSGAYPCCWGRAHLEDSGAWSVSFLWLACAAWSLLDFTSVASAWASGLGWLCSLRTRGRNLGSPTPWVCPQSWDVV
jgi:hypothetical protein